MEFEQIGGSVKKLSKNKFFIFALIAVILLAVYTMVKQNSGGENSDTDIKAILSAYPQKNTGDTNVSTETVNNFTSVMDALDDLQGYLDVSLSGIKNTVEDGNDSLKSDISAKFESTNGYLEKGLESIQSKQDLYQNTVLDKLDNIDLGLSDKVQNLNGDMIDRLDFLNQSVSDKTNMLLDKNQQFFDRLDANLSGAADRIDVSIKDAQHGIISAVNNQGDRLKDTLDANRKQENQEHSILSENINTWGERLFGRR